MVHGIGRHLPGYSARLTEHLMRELKLDVMVEDYKEIVLRDPEIRDGSLGEPQNQSVHEQGAHPGVAIL